MNDSIDRKATIAYILEILNNMPSAEPKRGEWMVYPLLDEGRVELVCPICEDSFIRAVGHKPHFCENCGADMRGEKE